MTLLWLAALPECRAVNGCLIAPDGAGQILWPPTLRELPADSFRGCQFLKEVSVPRWVTSIGAYAFAACPLLHSVVFEDSDESPSRLTSIGAGAFQNTLISSVVFPRALRYIGDEAFQYVPNVVSILIPASVVALGRSSFRCYPSSSPTPSQLRTVTFGKPSNLVVMESSAFDGCSQLEQTSVPPSCFVEEHAFRGTASAYIKEPFPPMPPSPPPALRPGDIDFRVEMQRGGGIAARVGIFVVFMLMCMCAACVCKVRKAADPPPMPVQSIIVIDAKVPMAKTAKAVPPPLGLGGRGGGKGGNAHESRLSDLSRRFTELEKTFKRKVSREAPPPPPYTAKPKTMLSSRAASLVDSERTELGLESSSVTPRGPLPAARLPPPSLSTVAFVSQTRSAPPVSVAPPSPSPASALTPSLRTSPSFNAQSDNELDDKEASPEDDSSTAEDEPVQTTFTSKADWRARRYNSSGASAARETAPELEADGTDAHSPSAPPANSKPRDRRTTAADYGSSMSSSAGAFEVGEARESDSAESQRMDVEDGEVSSVGRADSFDEESEEEPSVGGAQQPASRAARLPSNSDSDALEDIDESPDVPFSLKV